MIHPVIFRTTLRERVAAPGRWVSVVLLLIWPAFLTGILRGQQGAEALGQVSPIFETFIVWLIGAGLIGEEISSGTLLLVLARPVKRSSYVLGKWAALATLAAGVMVVQAALTGAVAWKFGRPVEPAALAWGAAAAAAAALGSAAVLVLFSVIAGSGKEIGHAMLAYAACTLLRMFAMAKGWTDVARFSELASGLLMPAGQWHAVVAGGALAWPAAAAFAFATVGSLTLAVVLLNRKELSYAAG